jgi:hypothetical protein
MDVGTAQHHDIGRPLQRALSGSTPHDRVSFLQICPSHSLPLHRPRNSALRYKPAA